MKTIENRDGWTEQRKQIVRSMWNGGETSGHIADVLGVSRSSVMGVVHRLGLTGNRRSTSTPTRKRRKPVTKFNFATKATKTKAEPKPADPYVCRETIVTPESKRISFEALVDGRCKYAHGDTPPYSFCGAKAAAPGGSWCETHFHAVFGTKPAQVSENLGELEQPGISRELEGAA